MKNKIIYHIPVNGISKEEAEKSLAELISNFKEDFDFSAWVRADRKKKLKRICQENH
jgi:hypothetical protein